MRLLLLTLYFDPDLAANSVIMTELAEKFVRQGHRVTVVTAFPHYDVNRIWKDYRYRILQRERRGALDIFRVYLFVPRRKTNLIGRLAKYMTFNVLSTLIGLLQPRHDVVFAPSPPLTVGLSARLISWVRRTPYIYNVQDIYPDIAERLKMLTSPLAIAGMRKLERAVYRGAKAVTVLSEGARQNLLRKGVQPHKIWLIPNFVDIEFVRPGPKDNPFARSHGLQDRFVVMYAGNIGLSQDLHPLLDAASSLRHDPRVQFVLVGNGAARDELAARAQRDGLNNVLFLPFQSRALLPSLYASADVGVVSLRSTLGDVSVPSKAYTIMASGRPMIAAVGHEAETRRLVEAAECGDWIRPDDSQAMCAAIQKLADDPALCRQAGENGRRYVEQHNTLDIVAEKYRALFASLGIQG